MTRPAMSRMHGIEDLALGAFMLLLLVVPLADAVLLATSTSLPDASAFGQHLTLILSMAGAAVAAREDRMLAIGAASQFLPGRLQPIARAMAYSAAAAISAWLAVAGFELAISERSDSQPLPASR